MHAMLDRLFQRLETGNKTILLKLQLSWVKICYKLMTLMNSKVHSSLSVFYDELRGSIDLIIGLPSFHRHERLSQPFNANWMT